VEVVRAHSMTLDEAIRTSINDRDYRLMTRIVDYLRDKYRMTCEGTRKYFEKTAVRNIHPAEWDEWMRECDDISSYM